MDLVHECINSDIMERFMYPSTSVKCHISQCESVSEIPEKKLWLAVNKNLPEGVSVSEETDKPVGFSALWRDWNFVGSKANLFILGIVLASGAAIPCPTPHLN